MKKLLILIVSLFSIFALGSCENDTPQDLTLVNDYTGKVLYEEHLKNIEFESECIKPEGYSTKVQRFDVFLPKDIKASSMYDKIEVEEYMTDKFLDFTVSYQSFSHINDANGGAYIRNILQGKQKDIAAAYGNFKILEDAFLLWNHKLNNNLDGVEGKKRELLVLYLPVKVAYFTPVKDADAKQTLETMVLVPVQLELVYNDSDLTNYKDFKEFNFKVENGLLK